MLPNVEEDEDNTGRLVGSLRVIEDLDKSQCSVAAERGEQKGAVETERGEWKQAVEMERREWKGGSGDRGWRQMHDTLGHSNSWREWAAGQAGE